VAYIDPMSSIMRVFGIDAVRLPARAAGYTWADLSRAVYRWLLEPFSENVLERGRKALKAKSGAETIASTRVEETERHCLPTRVEERHSLERASAKHCAVPRRASRTWLLHRRALPASTTTSTRT